MYQQQFPIQHQSNQPHPLRISQDDPIVVRNIAKEMRHISMGAQQLLMEVVQLEYISALQTSQLYMEDLLDLTEAHSFHKLNTLVEEIPIMRKQQQEDASY